MNRDGTWNGASLSRRPGVHLHVKDAFTPVRHCEEEYDAIFLDFPAPMDYSVSLLYSREFYSMVRRNLYSSGFAIMDMPGRVPTLPVFELYGMYFPF
jgi:predicted membrane-bound spermidine synthase